MIRGTTPTHYFDIEDDSVDASVIAKVNVLYGQDDTMLFKKKSAECTVDGKTISTKLTREQSLMFNHEKPAQVQVVVETPTGDVIETVVMTVGVAKLLDDGVIE